ncbi:MAG: PDZ domain-containing protein [Phycisphaerae bacterium]|nr:PDZ domain-containing protein [Phycisphaerae bacterium]
MKSTLELSRILSVASFVLLVIVGCIVVSLILPKDMGQDDAVNSIPQAAKAKIDLGSSKSPGGDPKVILERNIFGSAGADVGDKDSQNKKSMAPPAKPAVRNQLQLRLLGTVAGDKEAACAVIEDLTCKVQDLYQIGDIIQGARIEAIEQNKVVLHNEGHREVLNISVASKTSAPSRTVAEPAVAKEPSASDVVRIVSPTEREINKSAFLAKVGGVEAALKAIKVSPHIVDGESKGLRITGLEGLSMAKYAGLQNGDIIQTINGQSITNRRKAFQVLQKARALSSSDIQILSGTQKKTLSFRVE